MKENKFSLCFGGDFCTSFMNPNDIASLDHTVFQELEPILSESDYAVINLENPITDSDSPIYKTGPNLKSTPGSLKPIKESGIHAVSLANNHIYDYGDEGLKDTLKILAEEKIDHFGAGQNLENASRIFYKKIRGNVLAIINITENEWGNASNDRGGANPIDIIDNTKQINEAKLNSDQLILIIHGGHEHNELPNPSTVKLYRYYVEIGADAIISHHTHTIGGFEYYHGKPIFYGLGNLFFPVQKASNNWKTGLFLKIDFNRDQISHELFPFEQKLNKPYKIELIENDKKADVLNRIYKLNEIISDKERLKVEWENYCEKNFNNVFTFFYSKNSFLRKIIKRLPFRKIFLNRQQIAFIHNNYRCESHKEIMFELGKKYFQ
ncbi:CapA family protein [Maribellus sediminis]|uniref:CapA family protein n=1 Tax=Maribellus sediminis TaxID=2696285 RepID=UPI00142F78C4|nr:CapA family protein [Maribellus sediminis]